jgi:hypothetical protein
MEEVELDTLHNLSQEEVEQKFTKVGWNRGVRPGGVVHPCSICQPINSI